MGLASTKIEHAGRSAGDYRKSRVGTLMPLPSRTSGTVILILRPNASR
jgi:hypothetical protein